MNKIQPRSFLFGKKKKKEYFWKQWARKGPFRLCAGALNRSLPHRTDLQTQKPENKLG